jgi:SAM-dependent methyltransferase
MHRSQRLTPPFSRLRLRLAYPWLSRARVRDEFLRLSDRFAERARELGFAGLTDYVWYHTIDLGDGLVTPGIYDYRASLPAFRFPERMDGMTVLDVGSATGFFAFEFERRGATVVSAEIPSVDDCDHFPGETLEQRLAWLRRVMPQYSAFSPAQLDRLFQPDRVAALRDLHHGPFEFCHRRLGSRVRRCHVSIYDLSPERVGVEAFDLVFLGDVLCHLIRPLEALAAAARLCRGTLVVAQHLPRRLDPRPAMAWMGGDTPGQATNVWWLPNYRCFAQMLRKLGFRRVDLVGHHRGVARPAGWPYKRAVIHGTR